MPPRRCNSSSLATVETAADDVALMTFMRAIARRERARVSILPTAAPELAVASVGAAEECVLNEIFRLVYRGDTALQIAAAAYDAGIVPELVRGGG